MKILRSTKDVVAAIENYMVEFGAVMEEGANALGESPDGDPVDANLSHVDKWLLLSDTEKRAAILSLSFTVVAKEVDYADCVEREEG